MDFFGELLRSILLGEQPVFAREENYANMLGLENNQDFLMSTESKYASVYHACVDWRNFEHELPQDH